ncbi:hypothetical protein IU479_34775 [Nocardia abscessus]|nr:hypothetical protein [Nocardia abscessus]MBF6223240.1 hypothetical protein [Nocardia abscessus]
MWHSFRDQPDIPEAAEFREEVAAFLAAVAQARIAVLGEITNNVDDPDPA